MGSADLGFGLVLAVIAAVVPTGLYLLAVRWLDQYDRKPLALLVGAFLWGAVPAVIGSLILELILGLPLLALASSNALFMLAEASAVAPLVEEVLKAVALAVLVIFFRREFDGVIDGVVYGALVGFGFAMTENFFYFLGTYLVAGIEGLAASLLLRGVVFGSNHAFFTAIVGAGMGYAVTSATGRRRFTVPLAALAAAIGFHAVHNLGATIARQNSAGLLVSLTNIIGGVLLVVGIVIWALAQEKRWIAEELREEIGTTITEGEYDLLTRRRSLIAKRLGPLACYAGKPRYVVTEFGQLATKLAFRKHRARVRKYDMESWLEVQRLREQIAALRTATQAAI